MKTIILNQATLHPSFEQVDSLSYTTWGSSQNPDVKIIHYYGKYDANFNVTDKFLSLPNDGEVIMYDNTMVIGTYDDKYPVDHPRHSIINDARNEKFILALEYCINNFEFDYIQRICNTTYVDVEKMQQYLSTHPKNKIYNGARNMYDYKYYFVSGHDVFMSYDVVKLLVEHKEEYLASSYPEDLAAGKILIHDLEYTNFENQVQDDYYIMFPYDIDVKNISLCPVNSIWCYRIKHQPEVFKRVHELVLEKNKML